MHSVSVKMNDNDFELLDGMSKCGHKSKAEVISEALRVKRDFDKREMAAVMQGLESAEREPLTKHEDALKEFSEFRARHKGA